MAKGTRIGRVEDTTKVNWENVVALQTRQIKAQCQILENQARLGSLEALMTRVKAMLQELLQRQPEVNDKGNNSHTKSHNEVHLGHNGSRNIST